MIDKNNHKSDGRLIPSGEAEIIRQMEQSIKSGKHWYIALLEAIGLWTETEETYNGRHYRYLIDGEAFDWLLLAERLCQELNGIVPQEEIDAFLLRGDLPLELSLKEFKEFIGYHKYQNQW